MPSHPPRSTSAALRRSTSAASRAFLLGLLTCTLPLLLLTACTRNTAPQAPEGGPAASAAGGMCDEDATSAACAEERAAAERAAREANGADAGDGAPGDVHAIGDQASDGAPGAPEDDAPTAADRDPDAMEPLPSVTDVRAAYADLSAPILEALALENAAFALRLHHAVAQADPDAPNVVLSAWSVRSAFAMLFAGSRGETADELADGLLYGMAPARMYAAMVRVTEALDERTRVQTPEGVDPPAMVVVNDLWAQQDYPLEEAYTSFLEEAWRATLRTRDFMRAYEDARNDINVYVQEQTRDRIRDLLPPGSLSTDTRLVLTNAIWFRAGWQHVFDAARTQDASFTTRAGEQVQVPTMNVQASFPSAQVEGHVLIELPHVGGELGLVLLLPDEGSLDRLESTLEADTLFEWLGQLSSRQPVRLSLPRFEIRTSVDLGDILRSEGVRRVFAADQADLSGLSPRALEDGLHVSGAFHQAFLAVDEEGAEAAGATAVAVATRAMPAEPLVVAMDRPFLFFLRDRPTGTILFSGRVGDPR